MKELAWELAETSRTLRRHFDRRASALGVTTADGLRKARGYVIVGAFAIAAVVTPPDAISQIMLAIPMCGLYEIGILAARLVVRREQPTDAPVA